MEHSRESRGLERGQNDVRSQTIGIRPVPDSGKHFLYVHLSCVT